MILRWIFAIVGGACLAMALGALVCLVTPGPALNGIAMGVMVSALGWALMILAAMSTQRLGRFAASTGALTVLIALILAWSVIR